MFYRQIKLLKNCLKCRSSVIYNASVAKAMSNGNTENHIVWMDMEMTGLEIDTCHILEISCIITDSNLKIVSDALNIVINQPNSILNSMNSWCKINHTKTKLIKDVLNSKISVKNAEQIVLEYLQNHVPRGTCPMAGNSVYMDRLFLQKYMPLVNNYLHYRIIDVSTIKELLRRWSPQIYNSAPPKVRVHRANSDIKESIQELDYYKKYMFITQNS